MIAAGRIASTNHSKHGFDILASARASLFSIVEVTFLSLENSGIRQTIQSGLDGRQGHSLFQHPT